MIPRRSVGHTTLRTYTKIMASLDIQIPDYFSESLKTRFGIEADAWLENVPDLANRKLMDWNLTLENGTPLHGAMGLVFFVKRGNEQLVLKISWRDELTEEENKALRLWDGNGAVKLLEYDSVNHVSLMERLTKLSLAEINIAEAGIEAGRLIRKLGIKCEMGFPKLEDRIRKIRAELAMRKDSGQKIFDLGLVDELINRRILSIDSHLSHGDLGYLNVLQAHNKEWKAIDPKPIIGDLEFCLPELMWTRIDEIDNAGVVPHLERIVKAGNLDKQKAIDWTIIRAVDYYFWAVDNKLTIDPKRCMRLYECLVSGA